MVLVVLSHVRSPSSRTCLVTCGYNVCLIECLITGPGPFVRGKRKTEDKERQERKDEKTAAAVRVLLVFSEDIYLS